MEGSVSEAVFDSLNLNPQLFINEAINTADDLVEEAFSFFQEQASSSLKVEGTERAAALTKGANVIRKKVQSNLDKRLIMWEQYCLEHCFDVPVWFKLPKSEKSPMDTSNTSTCQDAISDPAVDAQWDLLRNNLAKVRKESAALDRELQLLEQQSSSRDRLSALVNETLQLYNQNSFDQMFQEMIETSSKFKVKVAKLKTGKVEKARRNRTDGIYNRDLDSSTTNRSKGFSGAKLDDLQETLDNMIRM